MHLFPFAKKEQKRLKSHKTVWCHMELLIWWQQCMVEDDGTMPCYTTPQSNPMDWLNDVVNDIEWVTTSRNAHYMLGLSVSPFNAELLQFSLDRWLTGWTNNFYVIGNIELYYRRIANRLLQIVSSSVRSLSIWCRLSGSSTSYTPEYRLPLITGGHIKKLINIFAIKLNRKIMIEL